MAVLKPHIPFVGREAVRAVLVRELQAIAEGSFGGKCVVHLWGNAGIGKTELVRRVLPWCANFERTAFLHLDLSEPYTLDPFSKLLQLRKNVRYSFPGIDTDAFDMAAVVFDRMFRDGVLTSEWNAISAFSSAELFEVGLTDALKSGVDDVAHELRVAGLGAAVGAFTTPAAVAKLVTGMVLPALSGAAVGAGAAIVVLGLKYLVRGIRKKARARKIFESCPLLEALLQDCRYDHFLETLPKLLGIAVADYVGANSPYTTCLTVDPADGFASHNPESAQVNVGKMLALFCAEEFPLLQVVTSRASSAEYVKRALANRALSIGKMEEVPLLELRLDEVRRGLPDLALSPHEIREWFSAGTPPTIAPVRLVALWNAKGEALSPERKQSQSQEAG